MKFVAESKMSKKARKELNNARRVEWGFSPVTRTKASKKLYNRRRIAIEMIRLERGIYELPKES